MSRAVAYWVALICSIFITLVSITLFILIITPISTQQSAPGPPLGPSPPNYEENKTRKVFLDLPWEVVIPLATLLLTTTSTLSAILLGWRVDRRQAKELDLKSKDLELKIKELEFKLMSTQKLPEIVPAHQKPNIPLC